MKLRILTALIGIPVVLLCILLPSALPLLFLLTITCSFALSEYVNLVFKNERWGELNPFFATALVLGLVGYSIFSRPLPVFTPATVLDDLYGVAILAGLGIAALAAQSFLQMPRWLTDLVRAFTLLWIIMPLVGLFLLHLSFLQGDWSWKQPLLLILFSLWAGDSAGLFVGKQFGKHLLAPQISPKKTWEGALGNFLAATLVALGIGIWFGFGWPKGLVCGLFLGVLGQLGDLAQSALKRKIGVKDSGQILPGHGGILDRIDSLLFTATPCAIVLVL